MACPHWCVKKSVLLATEVYGFQAGCEGTQQGRVRVGGQVVKERTEQTMPHSPFPLACHPYPSRALLWWCFPFGVYMLMLIKQKIPRKTSQKLVFSAITSTIIFSIPKFIVSFWLCKQYTFIAKSRGKKVQRRKYKSPVTLPPRNNYNLYFDTNSSGLFPPVRLYRYLYTQTYIFQQSCFITCLLI